MKRLAKMFAVTCVAALALAVSAAGALAAQFTASAVGSLTGSQTSNHVFTPGSFGSVTCTEAHTTGTIESTAAETQHVTVKYSDCRAFSGNYHATVTDATYLLRANGEVDIKNEIKVSVPGAFCTITVKPQIGRATVSYANKSSRIEQHSKVTGITSSGSGLCAGGSNGTYSGSSVVERVGGGTISHDA